MSPRKLVVLWASVLLVVLTSLFPPFGFRPHEGVPNATFPWQYVGHHFLFKPPTVPLLPGGRDIAHGEAAVLLQECPRLFALFRLQEFSRFSPDERLDACQRVLEQKCSSATYARMDADSRTSTIATLATSSMSWVEARVKPAWGYVGLEAAMVLLLGACAFLTLNSRER